MSIDIRQLEELLVESQDLQVDALRDARSSLPALEAIREDRRGQDTDPSETVSFMDGRRRLISRLGLGSAGILAGSGLGALFAGILARPAAADEALDVQILQTAASLEVLAVATYGAALSLPFIANGNPVIVKFAQTTMGQHGEHSKAFNAQSQALGGKPQNQPNPKYAAVVESAKPTLKTPLDVVKLAASLELVARDTFLADLAMFSDAKSKSVMGSIMGVETQHLTTLRAVTALLEAGMPEAIAIPVDPGKLPEAAGSAPFPQVIPMATQASPPEEGAVK